MANISEHRMKEIEAEMDRFEEEISGAPPTPPSSAAPRLAIGSGSGDKRVKDVPVRCEAPKFSALPPPPPPPVVSVAKSARQPLVPPPPPPAQPLSFVPPQLRHRLHMPPPPGPPRPPHMSGMRPPPRPPPLGPHLRGMPPRGPPPRGPPPPPFMGPPRPPPPPMGHHGPMPPHMACGPPHMGSGPRPMAGPPHMGGPPQMGGPRGPPPGYLGEPVQMQQNTEAEQGPSATIQKAKVVYAAPVKAADVVKQQLKASGKAKLEETEETNVAKGIQVNVPVSQIEAEKMKQGECTSATSTAGPQIVVPEIDVEAFVKKFQAEKAKKEKKKKFVRTAAGQVWEDNSLEEWDPDDFRIFCGDLGNEVTDEVLARAFSRYPTFQKARVVRDKRSNKTKGFGFVSFKDPNDFVKAMREMNGKYVGNRPIKLRKSNWKDRQIDIAKKKDKEKKKLGLR